MLAKRNWDASCPRVWSQWESDGISWVTQDLPPEDDEEAIRMLMTEMTRDEVLCFHSKITEDPESMAGIEKYWRACLARRYSIACYAIKDGVKTLAGLNCCIVIQEDDEEVCEVTGDRWINVYKAMDLACSKFNVFKAYGVDQVYYGMGLIVKTEYRGAKLGVKILEARKPLCDYLGIKVSSTLFTGPASQRCAEKVGFKTVAELSLKEMAEAGLQYPPKDNVVKLMVKEF